MKESLQCPACKKDIKKTRLVVIHPNNNRPLFVCSEACSRQILVKFCTKDQSIDFSSLKIYYNRAKFRDLPIFIKANKKPLNKRKRKKRPITKDEVTDFKINFGLDSNKIINKLIDAGKLIYDREYKAK